MDDSSNARIQREIRQQLDDSPHHELRNVRVQVGAQQIVLTGTVSTYFIKQMAQETARRAEDRRQVLNQVKVQ